jgi:hypothetical protein
LVNTYIPNAGLKLKEYVATNFNSAALIQPLACHIARSGTRRFLLISKN